MEEFSVLYITQVTLSPPTIPDQTHQSHPIRTPLHCSSMQKDSQAA